MRSLRLKRWLEHAHIPSRHTLAIKLDHVYHDERFWPIVVALVLIAAFIGLAIWAGTRGQAGQSTIPPYPVVP